MVKEKESTTKDGVKAHPDMPCAFGGLKGTTTILYCPGVDGGENLKVPLAGHRPPLTVAEYLG
jgi:hypothetical protein